MDQILEECEGCIDITDDITVNGHTEAEHDVCLQKIIEVAWKYGLAFTPKKTQIKAQVVKFFGYLYDESGVYLDPETVDAVHALPTPTNVTEFQEFLSIVMYLSSFIPSLSTPTAPIFELHKKDAEFNCDAPCQAAFQCVKDTVVNDTSL